MYSRLLFLLTALQPVLICGASFPHCTSAEYSHNVFHHSSTPNDTSRNRTAKPVTRRLVEIAIHDTLCLVTSNYSGKPEASLITAVSYTAAEQQYPVRWRYEFAIPHLVSHCRCHCDEFQQTPVCSRAEYQHMRCGDQAQAALCVRAYHSVASRGCQKVHSKAAMCCDIAVTPFENQTYWALGLGPPTQWASMDAKTYTCLTNTSGRSCRLTHFYRFRVEMNWKRRKVEMDLPNGLTVVSRAVPTVHRLGTNGEAYFVRSNERILRGGTQVNELNESNLHKLGWLRRSNQTSAVAADWHIEDALVRLQAAHKVTVQDCRGQSYKEKYLARQYVATSTNGDGVTHQNSRINLAGPVQQHNINWIKSASVPSPSTDRTVVVRLTNAASLDVQLQLYASSEYAAPTTIQHQRSFFRHFAASIHVDRHSNRFLNVSFENAAGKLRVYMMVDQQNIANSTAIDVSFSDGEALNGGNIYVPLSDDIQSEKWVCVYPDTDKSQQQCQVALYDERPLQWFSLPAASALWQYASVDCATCNTVPHATAADSAGFMSALTSSFDPMVQLFGGALSTPQQLAAGVAQTLFVFVVICTLVSLCRSLLPLVKCALCPLAKKR